MGILPMRNSAGITAWKAVPLHFFNGLLTPDKNLIAVGAESDERGKDDSRQIASDFVDATRVEEVKVAGFQVDLDTGDVVFGGVLVKGAGPQMRLDLGRKSLVPPRRFCEIGRRAGRRGAGGSWGGRRADALVLPSP
jgi:hypothetical protein